MEKKTEKLTAVDVRRTRGGVRTKLRAGYSLATLDLQAKELTFLDETLVSKGPEGGTWPR